MAFSGWRRGTNTARLLAAAMSVAIVCVTKKLPVAQHLPAIVRISIRKRGTTMKRLCIAATLIWIVSFSARAQANTYEQEVMADKPFVYYRLEEESGEGGAA